MSRRIKWIGVLIGGVTILAVAAGVLAFGVTSNARAQAASNWASGMVGIDHGGSGFPGDRAGDQTALADALGITLAQLQAAEQKASDAAIQQALDQGLITQDQANAMILRGSGFGRGFEGRGWFGASGSIDYDTLLAKELGISVDKLTAARQQAFNTLLDQAVANGTLTQEQADLIKARQALQSYIDPNTLFAQALGITTDQLQSYRDQGLTLTEILNKAGKTALEVRDAEQAAYQAAVQKAVTDGVITQAQADQFLAGGFPGLGGFGGGPGFGGRGGHGGRGFGGFGDFGRFGGGANNAPSSAPATTPGSGI